MRSTCFHNLIAFCLAGTTVSRPLLKRQDAAPMSGNTDILSTMNHYRDLYGLPEFAWNPTLAGGAEATGQQSNGGQGGQFHHSDGPDQRYQIMAPGIIDTSSLSPDQAAAMAPFTPFELTYMGAFLCEQWDPQIADTCQALQNIAPFPGYGHSSTGHHDPLVSPDYTQVGCAWVANPDNPAGFYNGLWTCNLA